jgi:hypothetical protein
MKDTFWRIVNRHGLKVTDRPTLKECSELLEKYDGTRTWSNGPYRIQKIEERTWRRRSSGR